MNIEYKVENLITINQILSEKLEISTRLKNKLIKNKAILLNGSFVDTRTVANPKDIVTILLDSYEDNSNIIPTKMNLDIVFEDEHLLAINKPAGIAIHPSILHFTDSLSNGIKYYFDKIGLRKKIRPINRIDLNTSGLVLFAKNEYVQENLIKQMNNGIFKKTYLAIVSGALKNKSGTIDAPIARKQGSIIERCVDLSGQKAVTHYEVIKEYSNYSLIKCILETGRTHQIRVHFAYIGNPLHGDTLYNTCQNNNGGVAIIDRQALHSYKMEFIHPINKNRLCLEAEIPEDMKKLIKS